MEEIFLKKEMDCVSYDWTGAAQICLRIKVGLSASYEITSAGTELMGIGLYHGTAQICSVKKINEISIARTFIKDKKYHLVIYCKQSERNIVKFYIRRLKLPIKEYLQYQWAIINLKNGVDINLLPAREYTRGFGVTIAIADTGIVSHNALINRIDNDMSYDFVHNISCLNPITEYCNNSSSLTGHATHIAGIIGASEESKILSIAPESKLISYKILGAPIKESKIFNNSSEAFVQAIQRAKEVGVNIINCSFGGENPSRIEYEAIKKAKDILFVISAGNKAKNLKLFPEYPACYKLDNIIVVAAIDNNGNLCDNSNYGLSVDIAAPGYKILGPYNKDSYIYASATSIATPIVTGICALVWSVNRNLSPMQVKSIITDKNNITKAKSLEGKVKNCGIIDAYRSVISAIELSGDGTDDRKI